MKTISSNIDHAARTDWKQETRDINITQGTKTVTQIQMTKTERTIAEIKDDIARVEQELAEAKQELATASATHVIKIVWGDRLDPTDVDPSEEIYTYSFETDAETKAFLAGVDGAIGWDGFAVMESTEEDFPVGGYSA